MSLSNLQHPSDEVLAGFIVGSLPAEVEEQLLSHARQCASCLSRLNTVAELGEGLVSPGCTEIPAGHTARLIQRLRAERAMGRTRGSSTEQSLHELLTFHEEVLDSAFRGPIDAVSVAESLVKRRGIPSTHGFADRAGELWLEAEVCWVLGFGTGGSHARVRREGDQTGELFALLPPLEPWLAYLATYPPGAACERYRVERVRVVGEGYAGFHPSERQLLQYDDERGPGATPDKVTTHILGPVVCLDCRRWLAASRGERKLAADDGNEEQCDVGRVRLPARPAGAEDRWIGLRYANELGFLHFFVRAEHGGGLPSAEFSIEFIFDDGFRLKERFRHPEQRFAGINAGKLGDRKLARLKSIRFDIVHTETGP